MRHRSETRDAPPEGWVAWSRGRAPQEPQPRLRLLVHADPGRVGWMSVPGVVPSGDKWLTIGRNEPLFTMGETPKPASLPLAGIGPGAARPLEDPHVSREQLRVRFRPDLKQFEVEPAPAARRPIHRVDLGPGVEATPAITGPTLLDPGTCVAIGDRVLLGLELGSFRAPAADRLGLVGESEAMWALRDEIRSVAQFGRAALVNGPTGAGKELVARALHAQSPRAAKPFVAVNCAALPETLAESVLFGHRKGAFTGATADEKGLFSAADGGTLFFDELGELPIGLQPKLLRALQDGIIVPVGAHEGRHVDVRVVAATHRDLEAHVHSGKLREDLYHRLSAHVIRVPALAERRFDVPELFVHMLGRLRAEHEALAWMWTLDDDFRLPLPIGFLVELMRRDWRGNVRELANLAERTARLNLHPGDFHAPEAVSPAHRTGPVPISRPTPSEEVPAKEPVAMGGDPPCPPLRAVKSPSSSEQTLPPDTAKPAVDAAWLRTASDTLGVARKTLLKLFPATTLSELAAEATRASHDGAASGPKPRVLAHADPGEHGERLRAAAAEALLTMLEAQDFNQSSVASTLGTSRTTLIKLMDDLGLPRAADLGADDILKARARAGGDLDAAARVLRVSPSALKKRATQLGLRAQD